MRRGHTFWTSGYKLTFCVYWSTNIQYKIEKSCLVFVQCSLPMIIGTKFWPLQLATLATCNPWCKLMTFPKIENNCPNIQSDPSKSDRIAFASLEMFSPCCCVSTWSAASAFWVFTHLHAAMLLKQKKQIIKNVNNDHLSKCTHVYWRPCWPWLFS